MSVINNRIRNSEFLRNVFTLISASSIAQAVAILIYPLLTRIYTPREHGLFALYMSIIAITSILATGKYEKAIMIPARDKDGAGLSLFSLFLTICFSLFLLLVILLLKDQITSLFGDPEIKRWLYFVPLSTFLVGVFTIFSNWSNRKKKYRRIATANLSQSLVNSGVKVSSPGLQMVGGGLILGAIAGQLTGAVIFLRGMIRGEFPSLSEFRKFNFRALAREYIFFPKFTMIHHLVNNFPMTIPVFVFSSYFSATEVGYFSLGFMMVNRPMNLLVTSFAQVFSQRIIEKYNKGQEITPDVRKLLIRLTLIAAPPLIIAGIAGPSIFNFIFGKGWDQAGRFMQIMLPWLYVVFISSPVAFLPDMLNRQKKAMWIDIFKFTLRVGGLFVGVLLGNIYWSIILFSGISMLFVSYTLYWYLTLSRNADKRIENKKET